MPISSKGGHNGGVSVDEKQTSQGINGSLDVDKGTGVEFVLG